MFQTFRPIDGVLSSYGHKKRTLKEAITQARPYKGSEIRIWGTLTAVWWDGKLLPDALQPSFKPAVTRVRTVSITNAAGGTLKAQVRVRVMAPALATA